MVEFYLKKMNDIEVLALYLRGNSFTDISALISEFVSKLPNAIRITFSLDGSVVNFGQLVLLNNLS